MAFALLLFPNQHNLRKTKSLAAGGGGEWESTRSANFPPRPSSLSSRSEFLPSTSGGITPVNRREGHCGLCVADTGQELT